MNKTRTAFLLMAQYERLTVSLDEVADDFLGMSKRAANARANAGELPFPVFRLGSSQKNPYMVHVDDLADFIEKQRADAHRQWERSQV